VRELDNAIQRALILQQGGVIEAGISAWRARSGLRRWSTRQRLSR
jgi:DNA-binding NtrC family response regulator